jgi:hypothetical protein
MLATSNILQNEKWRTYGGESRHRQFCLRTHESNVNGLVQKDSEIQINKICLMHSPFSLHHTSTHALCWSPFPSPLIFSSTSYSSASSLVFHISHSLFLYITSIPSVPHPSLSPVFHTPYSFVSPQSTSIYMPFSSLHSACYILVGDITHSPRIIFLSLIVQC